MFYLLHDHQNCIQAIIEFPYQEPNRCKLKMFSEGGQWTSRSAGYETREELFKGEGILLGKCGVCGHWINTRFNETTKKDMIHKNMCFSCNLWDDRHNIFQISTKIMIV